VQHIAADHLECNMAKVAEKPVCLLGRSLQGTLGI
jgi:hypothetical protein